MHETVRILNATSSLAVAALVFAVVAPSGRSILSFCVEVLVGCHFDVGSMVLFLLFGYCYDMSWKAGKQ